MFLTVHAAAGLYLGSQIQSPWLAFLIGYLSHWLLDLIPHGDENIIERFKYTETQLKWRFFFAAAIDTLGVIIIFYFFTKSEALILTPGTIAGMFGAVAPDYLWGMHKVTGFKLLKPLHQLHNKFHRLLANVMPAKHGALIQTLVFISLILLIIIR